MKLGGLGVLNPKLQQGALQLRWLRPLFRSPSSPLGLSILTAQFPDMMIWIGSEVDPSPLLSALSPNFSWNRLSTRRYRSSCQVAIFSTKDMQQDIRAIEWRQFWSFVLPYASRNIWFQLLHCKISCRSALHHCVPTVFPSATCSLCGTTDESQDHFLFACPLKLPLWKTFWHTHFGFSSQTSDIHNALYKFTFPPPLDPTLESASIFGSALLAVWRHHWVFVFDQALFIATNAITTANSLLSRLYAEENLDQSPYPI
ncbi:hypothetical protein PHYBLDRAFT_164915 [Phycomyces blakesleeanus NRRL 1555(-)]|uniref:Reverse transcriptase zinc-binding domain-containing protein n=1 Tax=Phycomyces blakesleeanus (strain ATCC 8743b / DSM 1359 / FGSC 10004 / NBRC 33097 / NRRL 1555) TaxID=763407 RepID=A0A162UU78_PHYB8|nr:hypothetical protein PHYBLDRAFT_164915 [Phycomyces blakesleeanus NRRL 1555(-)]OAD78033.1 hypothetical protein PHYBLDRAFT_164915 [Phycomyces blakesleeanus NRRL 1555(-)]|eukprot:XP_018296073.1 hypothetical protein PHYBLDRAFT_164915 [Phycomyces blakesleeanus NRRL 1555(-)]